MIKALSIIAFILLAIAGCGRAPYEPTADARVMRQFYLECREDQSQNDCVVAVRDEFLWAFGEDLEYVINGEIAP